MIFIYIYILSLCYVRDSVRVMCGTKSVLCAKLSSNNVTRKSPSLDHAQANNNTASGVQKSSATASSAGPGDHVPLQKGLIHLYVY